MGIIKHTKVLFGVLIFVLSLINGTFAQEKMNLTVHFSAHESALKKIKYEKKVQDSIQAIKVANRVIQKIHAKGFLTATIDSLLKKSGEFHVYITTGIQYKWLSLTNGNIDSTLCKELNINFSDYTGKPFFYVGYLKLAKDIVAYMENNGYPFATIKLKNVNIKDTAISAELWMKKNAFYRIDSILVEGDAIISTIYLQNYLGIEPGNIYNEAKIKKIDQRLQEIPFIQVQKPTDIYFSNNRGTIQIYADKKNASRFDGIIGFLPNNEKTGNILLTGDVNLQLINNLNSGEEINFRWRKLQAQTQNLDAQVYYPYIFDSFIGIDLELHMYKKDTTYLNLERGIGFRYLFTGQSYLKIYYALHTTDLLSVEKYKNNNTLPPFLDMKTDYYGIGAKIKKLDYIYNPRKGFSINTDISAGLRKIKINNNLHDKLYKDIRFKSTNYIWRSQLEYYIPLWKHNTILLANKTGYLKGEELFENELFRIGGLKSLRGFDEESIIASMYSIFTLEMRYLFEKNAFLSIFTNGAYYEKNIKDTFVHDKPFGIGAGINFETRAGIFSLNYAVGKQFGNTIDLKTTKIHFGFAGMF